MRLPDYDQVIKLHISMHDLDSQRVQTVSLGSTRRHLDRDLARDSTQTERSQIPYRFRTSRNNATLALTPRSKRGRGARVDDLHISTKTPTMLRNLFLLILA